MDPSLLDKIKSSTLSHLCLAIILFTSGLIINFFQFILYCTLRLYDKRLFRKISWYLNYSLNAQLVFFAEWWANCKCIVYANKEDYKKYFGKEHGYLVMNHTYETDWLIGWMIVERLQLLGNAKAYCKKAIQYVPVVGWSWKFSEYVFLERNFEKDRKNIDYQVGQLSDYPDPMWLLLYPEGTRFTEEKHKASIEFARKTNQPELKHHLFPRTKGFIASVPAMRGKVPAIYDSLIIFKEDEPNAPTMKNLLMGKPVTGHLLFRRIPLEQVPESDEKMDKFLKDLFVLKDKMKDNFLKHGDFYKDMENTEKVEPLIIERRYFTLLNFIGWALIVLIPMISYLLKLLFSGQLIQLSVAAGIIGIFYFLLQNLLNVTDIKKGSKYGIDSKKAN